MNQPKNKIYFDRDSHSYYADYKRTQLIPHYSGIIKEVLGNKFDKVPYDILKAAQERGTAVHHETEAVDMGLVSLQENKYRPFVEQWERFKKDAGIKNEDFLLIEQPLFSKTLWHGITPDRATKQGTVIEIKTSCESYKDYRLQTAAQALAIEENYDIKITKRMLVFLTESTYKTEIHDNPKDFEYWRSVLNTFKWKVFEK